MPKSNIPNDLFNALRPYAKMPHILSAINFQFRQGWGEKPAVEYLHEFYRYLSRPDAVENEELIVYCPKRKKVLGYSLNENRVFECREIEPAGE